VYLSFKQTRQLAGPVWRSLGVDQYNRNIIPCAFGLEQINQRRGEFDDVFFLNHQTNPVRLVDHVGQTTAFVNQPDIFAVV